MSMRPRTPSFIWLPFLFSVETVSWGLLMCSLAILAAVIIAPAYEDVRVAEIQRNDLQATVDLLDQKIKLQEQFIQVAGNDPLLMQRLASRQLNLQRKDQEVLPLDNSGTSSRDRSAASLLADSLQPVTPRVVSPLPAPLLLVSRPAMRSLLLTVALVGMVLSFLLGVRYERQ